MRRGSSSITAGAAGEFCGAVRSSCAAVFAGVVGATVGFARVIGVNVGELDLEPHPAIAAPMATMRKLDPSMGEK